MSCCISKMNNLKRLHRIGLVARTQRGCAEFKKLVKQEGFQIDQKNPQLVFSVGGDGTFLFAERKYPVIPKILVRDKSVCIKCNDLKIKLLLSKLKKGKFWIEKKSKLKGAIKGLKIPMIAVNDIIVRNKKLTEAIRFKVSINKKLIKTVNKHLRKIKPSE